MTTPTLTPDLLAAVEELPAVQALIAERDAEAVAARRELLADLARLHAAWSDAQPAHAAAVEAAERDVLAAQDALRAAESALSDAHYRARAARMDAEAAIGGVERRLRETVPDEIPELRRELVATLGRDPRLIEDRHVVTDRLTGHRREVTRTNGAAIARWHAAIRDAIAACDRLAMLALPRAELAAELAAIRASVPAGPSGELS